MTIDNKTQERRFQPMLGIIDTATVTISVRGIDLLALKKLSLVSHALAEKIGGAAGEEQKALAKTLDDYIPVEQFGKDHWSTLCYAETVMVDVGGFQIGCDAKMRQGRRNFRVMQECRRPKRNRNSAEMAQVMELKHSTQLRDGTIVEGHDDWHCIQDMAEAGYFEGVRGGDCEPRVTLHLSSLGREVVGALRAHKSAGGTFADFAPPRSLVTA